METVLFDLDGTLVDTAPDLASSLNRLLVEHGKSPLPREHIRHHVSRGSVALITLAFGDQQEHQEFENKRLRLLDIYRKHLCDESQLFPGMPALLNELESQGIRWGIVTNKPGWLTDPLVNELGLAARMICAVSGDTTDQRKPHPKPMLLAAELAGSEPRHCVYLGDDPRDIEAGNAAGMTTLVAGWGYIESTQATETWGACGILSSPLELLNWLQTRKTIAQQDFTYDQAENRGQFSGSRGLRLE